MDNKLLLCKSLTLLYRESQLTIKAENSSDLVRTVLENVQVSELGIGIGTERDNIIAMKSTILEMCNNPADHVYDKTDILQRVKMNAGNDEKFYECIEQGISDDLDESVLKRMITNIRKQIMNHFKEQTISDILNKASYSFKFARDKIKDVNQFITEVIGQLEPLQMNSGAKDPAVVNDLDLSDDASVKEIFREIQKSVTGTKVYKTGWQALNRMLQGGFRPGEFWMINALQHKYKTGFTLSLFKQLALYNKPFTEDPNKKPLILRISFEDELKTNLQFLYQSLKYDETKELVDIKNASTEEMQSYVKSRMQVNGFHVKMMRVDPTMWTYRNICNKIIELEAEGYAVEVLLLDYLAMVPTIGCTSTGPMGTDLRDLFRRVRNFASSRGITVITPQQMSPDAKSLLRSGLSEDQLVKEVNEKGFFSGSKQLDQECDGIIHIHLFKHNKETYFSVQRDKHRIPTVVPDEHKYYLMKFPKYAPLPDDIDSYDTSFSKMSSAPSNANEDLFKLG